MTTINYLTYEYDKLKKYLKDDLLYISNNTHIKITIEDNMKGNGHILTIDAFDFVNFDIFQSENNIECLFHPFIFTNVQNLIRGKYDNAIQYLVENNFKSIIFDNHHFIKFFILACQSACINIIMSFIAYLKNLNLNENKNHFSTRLANTLSEVDANILMIVLENVPKKYLDYDHIIKTTVEKGQLRNLLLIEEHLGQIDIPKYLHNAIISGHVDIVEYMISKGANIEAYVFDNLWIVYYCAKYDHIEMMDYLLNHIVFTKNLLDKFLQEAYNDSAEYVDLLINAGANFVLYGEELYEKAIENNNIELAAYLRRIIYKKKLKKISYDRYFIFILLILIHHGSPCKNLLLEKHHLFFCPLWLCIWFCQISLIYRFILHLLSQLPTMHSQYQDTTSLSRFLARLQ